MQKTFLNYQHVLQGPMLLYTVVLYSSMHVNLSKCNFEKTDMESVLYQTGIGCLTCYLNIPELPKYCRLSPRDVSIEGIVTLSTIQVGTICHVHINHCAQFADRCRFVQTEVRSVSIVQCETSTSGYSKHCFKKKKNTEGPHGLFFQPKIFFCLSHIDLIVDIPHINLIIGLSHTNLILVYPT